jgi:hypothetical protein
LALRLSSPSISHSKPRLIRVGGSITNSPAFTWLAVGVVFAAGAAWAAPASRLIDSAKIAVFNVSPRLRRTIPQ